jgi:hypothetical protein
MQSFVLGGVMFCYTILPGTCQEAHERCEALGHGYRLMCGNDWTPGRSGEGCGNDGAYTAYDLINEYFPSAAAIGTMNEGMHDCVVGGQNNACLGDSDLKPSASADGRLAFCSPKNFFTEKTDGADFANFCGD